MARKRRRAGGGGFIRLIETVLRLVIGGILRGIWVLFSRFALIFLITLGCFTAYYYSLLPPVEELLDGRVRGSVVMLDRRGDVFAERGSMYGGAITTNSVSPYLKDAVIATEDKRFYNHFGISPRGIASAIKINMAEGRGPFSGHGGSTITQQVTKLICFGQTFDLSKWASELDFEADCRQSTIARKLKEVPFAFAMEMKYSKDDILNIYLNRAYLGNGFYGFEAAAQGYFEKSARNVKPAEAAMLAGLLKAPSAYSPISNLERAQGRASLIIGLMEEQGYLGAEEAKEAKSNPAKPVERAGYTGGGAFADWLMISSPDYLSRNTTEDIIMQTTFDPVLQRRVETAVNEIYKTKIKPGSKAQTAVVVMARNGAVRAMYGGRERTNLPGQFNRATQAVRQTGSSFKPFVYAAALESGAEPYDIVDDSQKCYTVKGNRKKYCPKNYGNSYKGNIYLVSALARSSNAVAVNLADRIGTDKIRDLAYAFGIQHEISTYLPMALGASEATLLEMTGAYAGFLNSGRATIPYGVTEYRLAADGTPILTSSAGFGPQVISKETAEKMVFMLNQVVDAGTGKRAKLPDREAAGKTGTTQGAKDAWFIGFTADYVTGVWMGYDDGTKLTGVTGGGLPAEMWREVMVRVDEGVDPQPLPMAAIDKPVIPKAPPLPLPESGAAAEQEKAQQKAQQKQQQKAKPKSERDTIEDEVRKAIESTTKNVLEDVLKNILGD